MTDVVYIIGKGSRWQNNELRYSLRSIEKNLKGFNKIWIVGEKPNGVTGINHIQASDPYTFANRASNILYKLLIACKRPEISDNFLYFNDDHYLLNSFDAEHFPAYFDGKLEDIIDIRKKDNYGRACSNSLKFLKESKLNTLNFDVHYPMLINKKAFLKIFDKVKTDIAFGHVVKSIYANAMKYNGIQMEDCKSHRPPRNGEICFSTYPNPTVDTRRWLFETFRYPSKYEI